jgi:hypothetical protein
VKAWTAADGEVFVTNGKGVGEACG